MNFNQLKKQPKCQFLSLSRISTDCSLGLTDCS